MTKNMDLQSDFWNIQSARGVYTINHFKNREKIGVKGNEWVR